MWPFKKKVEQRAEQGFAEYDDPVLQAIFGSGEAISKETALQIPQVAGSIDLIAGIIAGTPIKLYRDETGKTTELPQDYRLRLLNDETGDTLNANEFWHAMVRDYFVGKGGYAYIHKVHSKIQGLYYVDEARISILQNEDPIFKDFDIQVNGASFHPYEFLKLLRNTRNGAEGVPITQENSRLITAAYAALVLETNMARRGGNKKGFLKSDRKIDSESLKLLREAFARLYSGNGEGSDNFVVLNNGIDFKESSNTSVELQLNENKLTNAGEFAKLFHVSPDVAAGKATAADTESLAKLAAIPLMNYIQCALNRDLLLESEKGQLYFAFDTKELLKGDMQSRFAAYKAALDGNWMQVDEVRYKEDMEPLGLNWIKLGLQDVLYDPKTKQVFAPNTGKTAELGEQPLPDAPEDATLEQRAYYKRDSTGRFAGGGGRGSIRRKKDGPKYSPSPQRSHSGVKIGPKKYAKLCGTLNTQYPGLKAGETRSIFDSTRVYHVTADGCGGMAVNRTQKIKDNG